jgi:hypothetical protein
LILQEYVKVYHGELKAEIMRGGSERITIVETSKNSEQETEAPEEQMATYERGNSNEEEKVKVPRIRPEGPEGGGAEV